MFSVIAASGSLLLRAVRKSVNGDANFLGFRFFRIYNNSRVLGESPLSVSFFSGVLHDRGIPVWSELGYRYLGSAEFYGFLVFSSSSTSPSVLRESWLSVSLLRACCGTVVFLYSQPSAFEAEAARVPWICGFFLVSAFFSVLIIIRTGISGTSRSAKLLDEESGSWGVELEGLVFTDGLQPLLKFLPLFLLLRAFPSELFIGDPRFKRMQLGHGLECSVRGIGRLRGVVVRSEEWWFGELVMLCSMEALFHLSLPIFSGPGALYLAGK
ncbi:hypothetical protein C8J57DRAFT_1212743 [Mycena rebaudengoi]|nr:hypothetical protein C8J57DRAFT_1212743 [Mycena rebaudengoi]